MKKKGLLAVGCCLLLLAACNKKNGEQTALPDEQIARVMADLYIADAATLGLSGYKKDSLLQIYFNRTMEMHGVTREGYEKDLRILANDMPRMEKVVKRAEEMLETEDTKPGDKEELKK